MRYVHHNKCAGGHAFEEVDHKIYCLGREDYDQINHVCKSNGGCAPERKTNGENLSE